MNKISFNPSLKRRLSLFLLSIKHILSPHPLSCDPTYLSCTPFFVVSTGRSGTTLLRTILAQHSDLVIPPEWIHLSRLVANYRHWYCVQPWNQVVKLVGSDYSSPHRYQTQWQLHLSRSFYRSVTSIPVKQRSLAKLIDEIYVHYGQKNKPNATRWGDKTPINIKHLDLLDAVFPTSKIIHLYRDGRDVVATRYNLGWESTLEESCDLWLDQVSKPLTHPLRSDPQRFFEIRYENFVSQPEATIKKTCDFLELDFVPEMLQHHQNLDAIGTTATLPHHQALKQPINSKSIGKWRRLLTDEEQVYVQQRLRPMLIQLGYEID